MDNKNEILKKIIENLIECPVCKCKSLSMIDEHFVCCENCGPFTNLSIDTDTFKITDFELQNKEQNKAMPRVQLGDIVRINSVHSDKLNCYEVSSVESDGVVSQPAGFHHRYDEIIAIYRFDGTDFRCIWESPIYKEQKPHPKI